MHKIVKYNAILSQFAICPKAFTPDECDQIQFIESLQDFEKGTLGLEGSEDKSTRNSEIIWVREDHNSSWLFNKFSQIASRVNYEHFMLDVDGYDAFQYTKYSASEKQHYDWHTDSHYEYLDRDRKISAIIMLSDPSEYEGGEFECIHRGNPNMSYREKPQKGDVLFFASWMSHKVHPVLSGTRKSLVCWIMGKREC
jgi:PKHD-type hydroxylase